MLRYAFVFSVIVLLLPTHAQAALLYLDSDGAEHGLGDTFIVSVRLDNEDECINAAHVEVVYPKDRLRAVDFSRGGSILNLWVEEPKIDTMQGTVSFSGGVPGGYCGRIQGDPALSNILGKVVFTVISADAPKADIDISIASRLYLNDGQGTKADVRTKGATFTLAPDALAPENPWIKEVEADDTPPDPFDVIVESTRGVFGGRYYIVFATEDKQSGMDHFEIYERSAWKTIKSPYNLRDQSLVAIKVRAIDKAGNERLGDYTEGSAPERVRPFYYDYLPFIVVIVVFLILAGATLYMRRLHGAPEVPPAPQA